MNQVAPKSVTLLLFSHNKTLANDLSHKAGNIKLNKNSSLKVIHNPPNIDSSSDSDIIIYDLGLVNADLKNALNDLRRVKPKPSNKIVLLIGKKEDLQKAQGNQGINSRVTRYFRRSATASQLLMAIESHISKEASQLAPLVANNANEAKNNVTLKVVGAILFFVIAIGLGSTFFGSNTNKPAETGSPSTTIASEKPLTATPSNEITDNRNEIKKLIEQGLNARMQGKIYEPEKNNALFYFEQALKLDSFNGVAYQNQQTILQSLRRQFPALIQNKEFYKAQGTVSALAEYEAFHHDNPEMQRELNRAIRDAKAQRLASSKP